MAETERPTEQVGHCRELVPAAGASAKGPEGLDVVHQGSFIQLPEEHILFSVTIFLFCSGQFFMIKG